MDPKNNKFNNNAPMPDKFKPELTTLNKYITHHILISQKKFGCLLYLNKPSVINPFLYVAGKLAREFPFCFNKVCFVDWNLNCC